MRRPIENNSQAGDAVYDPFVGSGTTIIAAEMMGRSCYSIEIDPAYIDVCIRRWESFTGNKATLDGKTFDEVAAERHREDEIDAAVARDRLREIENNPTLLVTGDAT